MFRYNYLVNVRKEEVAAMEKACQRKEEELDRMELELERDEKAFEEYVQDHDSQLVQVMRDSDLEVLRKTELMGGEAGCAFVRSGYGFLRGE